MFSQPRLEDRLRRNYLGLTAPALAVYLLGMLVPLIIGFYYSLTDWNGFSPQFSFIGFENYTKIFRDSRFLNSLKFTSLFVIFNTIIQNALALLFAVILDSGIKGKNIYKTILFVPGLLSPVLVGFLWSRLLGSVYPEILVSLGFSGSIKLLTNPDTVIIGLLIINNWMWIGYWMLIYLAALQAVPAELYESASIEGAGAAGQFFRITVPMIMPTITFCIVAVTLGGFQVYELIVTATGGGPGHASESFIMYIYNLAFASERAAFASANSMIYVVFLLIVAFVQLKLLNRRES